MEQQATHSARAWAKHHRGMAVAAGALVAAAAWLGPSMASANQDDETGRLGNALEQRERMIAQLQTLNTRLERLEKTMRTDADQATAQLNAVQQAVRDSGTDLGRRLDRIEKAVKDTTAP